MKRFVEGEDRRQATLLPECLDDYVRQDNPVRVIEVFIDELDLGAMGFAGVVPEATGRPAYHPATLLKIYLYGYLNRIQSSRRLERETQRNIELMWLTGRLMPDFKTIADFRRDNGPAIRAACAQFVVLCRQLNLFTRAVVAIDGSKFKAVNTRDKNFTVAKVAKRIEQVEASIARYLAALDRADRQDDDVAEVKTVRLKEKIVCFQELAKLASTADIGRKAVIHGSAYECRLRVHDLRFGRSPIPDRDIAEISGTSEYSNLFQCFSMLLSQSEVPQSTKPTH
jgi:transposase